MAGQWQRRWSAVLADAPTWAGSFRTLVDTRFVHAGSDASSSGSARRSPHPRALSLVVPPNLRQGGTSGRGPWTQTSPCFRAVQSCTPRPRQTSPVPALPPPRFVVLERMHPLCPRVPVAKVMKSSPRATERVKCLAQTRAPAPSR